LFSFFYILKIIKENTVYREKIKKNR